MNGLPASGHEKTRLVGGHVGVDLPGPDQVVGIKKPAN
jgi:hypothetical protein